MSNTYGERDLVRYILMESDDSGVTWTPVFDPTAGGGGGDNTMIIKEDDATVSSAATIIDFDDYFDVTDSPTNHANISIKANTITATELDTTVAPASHGTATQVATFTVAADGRLTAAGVTTIAIAPSNVSDLSGINTGDETAGSINTLGAVMETDFGAQTVLAATDADTPLPLTVLEQRLVGRLTAGDVTGLTATEVRSVLNVEDGADVTDTDNVDAADALMDSDVDIDIKTLVLPADTTITTYGASLTDDTDAVTARGTLELDTDDLVEFGQFGVGGTPTGDITVWLQYGGITSGFMELERHLGVPAVGATVKPQMGKAIGALKTTDDAVKVVVAMATEANITYYYEIWVVARRQGGTAGSAEDSAAFHLHGCVANKILEASTDDVIFRDQAGWTAAAAMVYGNLFVSVVGAVDNDIVWSGKAEYISVGA